MTINKSLISVATATLLVVSFAGCGGGGSSGATAGGATSTTTTGNVADGYIKGATVCLDTNNNGKCDSDEPFAITGADGNYTLIVTPEEKAKADKNAPLLVSGGMDIDTKTKLTGTFKAPYTGGTKINITPITTLVSAMVAKDVPVDTAYKQVAKALGLTETEVKSDPVKLAKDNNNTKVIQVAMTINSVITTMAKAADVNNSKIYSDLVTAIKTVADDNTSTKKSIATIVTTAADETNSTLPPKAQEAAKVANTIEKTISDAINKYGSTKIQDAAFVSDKVVDNIHKEIDANETIANIDKNALTTPNSANLVRIAVKNILDSYLVGTTIPNSAINSIANNFTSSSKVSVENIIASSDINSTIKSKLTKAYTAQQIKLYVEKNGQKVSDSEVAQIAAISGIDYTTLKTMSLADFSKKIYDSGDADLMSLSLKLSPPANIVSMDDITKAKALFTSVRTQVKQADSFTQNESTKINTALQDVTDSVTFTGKVFNTLNDMIDQAIDTNQTTVSRLEDNGDRNITVSKDTASGNVTWNYTITHNTTTSWSGSLTYPDVYPDNFDPSNFKTLKAKLTGTMPIDYYGAKIPAGDKNSQNVDANIVVTKTANGAKINLNATIVNNSNSVKITDANLLVAYDVNSTTKEPLTKYVELQNLYVNGTVGDYTLDGELNIPSYAINKIDEAKGFDPKTTYNAIGGEITCDGNVTINPDTITFTYNGVQYNEAPWAIGSADYYSPTSNTTRFWVGFDDVKGYTSGIVDANSTNNYGGLESCKSPSIDTFLYSSWTDENFENSGYIPSEITFNGTLTDNNTSAYLNANIDAKWTNIVDANLSDKNFVPYGNVTIKGKLAMPASPVMNVVLNFNSTATGKKVNVTYVNDDTSITAKTYIPSKDSNITVNLSSTAGVQAKIVTDSHGHVDYSASTLTNKSGKTIGSFVDRAGIPAIKYADGTFETLF